VADDERAGAATTTSAHIWRADPFFASAVTLKLVPVHSRLGEWWDVRAGGRERLTRGGSSPKNEGLAVTSAGYASYYDDGD
jgi:hypothetical protein